MSAPADGAVVGASALDEIESRGRSIKLAATAGLHCLLIAICAAAIAHRMQWLLLTYLASAIVAVSTLAYACAAMQETRFVRLACGYVRSRWDTARIPELSELRRLARYRRFTLIVAWGLPFVLALLTFVTPPTYFFAVVLEVHCFVLILATLRLFFSTQSNRRFLRELEEQTRTVPCSCVTAV